MNDNFHIDNEIIEKLFNRDEKGLDLLTDHYHRFCESIIREVLDNDADVQECFNDLLLGIWNSIPPNRPLYLSHQRQITAKTERSGTVALGGATVAEGFSDYFDFLYFL
ncbi:MAG: hypothetical protein IKW18_07280 [Clostridia bacterium]|nr:hypothetical protein [Clostridia bacterium]